MKRSLFLPVLVLASSLFFSACASDSGTDPNNDGGNQVTVPVGTVKVTIDGTTETYTQTVSSFNPSDTAFAVECMDPDNIYSRFRIFVYNPAVKTFPIEKSDRPGEVALIQAITAIGEGPSFIAHTGTLKMTKREGKSYAGTFSFTASADGTTNGTQVQGTSGEFNLETIF
ncbi:MAG TPA: hypothetical protein VFH43_09830 [Candidatus Kapabacteria bacterium]|nr:hypothetical protein [Candidatus Kapabacteria bacterium]